MASSARREELMKERNKGEDLGWKGRREFLISRVTLHKMHVGRMHSAAAAAAATWCWQRVGRCVLAEQSSEPGLRISCSEIHRRADSGVKHRGQSAGMEQWGGRGKAAKEERSFLSSAPPASLEMKKPPGEKAKRLQESLDRQRKRTSEKWPALLAV